MNNTFILVLFVCLLVIIFLITIKKIVLTKQELIILISISGFFIFVVYFVDRVYVPGLWQKFFVENSLDFWIARLAYFLAVISYAFRTHIAIPIVAGVVSVVTILVTANNLRVEKEKINAQEIAEEKLRLIVQEQLKAMSQEQPKPKSDFVSSGKGICVVDQIKVNDHDVLILSQDQPRITLQVSPGVHYDASPPLHEQLFWVDSQGKILDTIYHPNEWPPGKERPNPGAGNIYLEAARYLGPGDRIPVTVWRLPDDTTLKSKNK